MELDDVALNDEIEALLTRATPSPQFRSGVLQRVDSVQVSGAERWFGLASVTSVMATLAVLIVMTAWWLGVPINDESAVAERVAVAPAEPAPSAPAVPAPVPQPLVPTISSPASTPPVQTLVAADEVAAYRAFVSIVQDGRLSADMFQSPADLSPAFIEPLQVEPLASIPPLKEPEL